MIIQRLEGSKKARKSEDSTAPNKQLPSHSRQPIVNNLQEQP